MHNLFMQEALQLAERGRYSALPNPMVGCVVVKDGQIVGRGFHEKSGKPHAEIHALREAGDQAKDATLYVTLEPCNHFGRTPPCTDAIIKAGITKVFVACLDPNPLVAGQGIQKLKAHGITVHIGILEQAAKALNQIFFHYITTKTPYIIAKWAMSLDGKIAVNPGDNRQLSNEHSMHDLHELRHRTPGILIGAATALADNPSLTVRFGDVKRQPQRIVLNSKGDLPNTLKLFDGSLPGKTWLICAEEMIANYPQATTEIIHCKTKNGHIDLLSLLKILGERELAAVLVEGGKQVLDSFFEENLVNEVVTYVTPWIIGNFPHKIRVSELEDIKLRGIIKE